MSLGVLVSVVGRVLRLKNLMKDLSRNQLRLVLLLLVSCSIMRGLLYFRRFYMLNLRIVCFGFWGCPDPGFRMQGLNLMGEMF